MSSRRRGKNTSDPYSSSEAKVESETVTPPHQQTDGANSRLPFFNSSQGGFQLRSDGESGRRGFHPLHFFQICFRSTSLLSQCVNVLWPVVPAAIAIRYALPDNYLAIFITSYIAMVPAANTVGFAGQEFARKLPHVFGVILETAFGSIVEIVLFMVLVAKNEINVVRAAILGSLLANLLLCLGVCFIAGALSGKEQVFHEAVSEVGSGLMLVAGMGLILPAIFAIATTNDITHENGVLVNMEAENLVLSISRATAIILFIAFLVYVYFNMSSHHNLMTEIYEADEEADRDGHLDAAKKKLTFTECVVALAISITCVTLVAIFLVEQIKPIVENRHISDAFMGLILVPLVEKLAEHLTAVDEAYDNQANLALAHVLGASIQTALLNTPLVVFVGWGIGSEMDLNFKQFEAVILILAIIVVGNFLRDGKSNYLEGVLCVFVYVIIAVAAWYYPNPLQEEALSAIPPTEGGGGARF